MDDRIRALRHRGIAALTGIAALAAPAWADAHSLVRVNGSEVISLSADATSLNTLTVRVVGSDFELRDLTVDGGMDPGTCRPGDVDRTGFIVQTFCPRAGVSLVRLDTGDREDTVTAVLPVPVAALGGDGADRLRTGPAADTLLGDAGDDSLIAAGGDDTLEGGLGVDALDSGPVTTRSGCATDWRTRFAAARAPTGWTPTPSTRSRPIVRRWPGRRPPRRRRPPEVVVTERLLESRQARRWLSASSAQGSSGLPRPRAKWERWPPRGISISPAWPCRSRADGNGSPWPAAERSSRSGSRAANCVRPGVIFTRAATSPSASRWSPRTPPATRLRSVRRSSASASEVRSPLNRMRRGAQDPGTPASHPRPATCATRDRRE